MRIRRITEHEYCGRSASFAFSVNPVLYIFILDNASALGVDTTNALMRGILHGSILRDMEIVEFLERVRSENLSVRGIGVTRLALLRRVLLA